MPTFLNPADAFDELIGFFEISADEGGVEVDAELCGAFAEALADLGEKFAALVAFARAMGLVETIEPPARRSSAERAALVRLMADRGEPVVLFPSRLAAPQFALSDDGGAA